MNWIHHHTISSVGVGDGPIRRIQKALVVRRVVLLVEAGGKTEVGQLDMTILVDQNVVGFDIAVNLGNQGWSLPGFSGYYCLPMYEAHFMDGVNG